MFELNIYISKSTFVHDQSIQKCTVLSGVVSNKGISFGKFKKFILFKPLGSG